MPLPNPHRDPLLSILPLLAGCLHQAWQVVAATVGVVMPSFIIILLIARKSANIFANSYVRSALCTIRPVIVGLITVVIFRFAKLGFVTANTTRFPIEIRVSGYIVFAGSYLVCAKTKGKKFSPVMVVLAFCGPGDHSLRNHSTLICVVL